MRILIITSCTGEKAVRHENALTLADFRKGSKHIKMRQQELSEFLMPARHMYTGEQQLRLLRGLDFFSRFFSRPERLTNNAVPHLDLKILSAGYGFVQSEDLLAPYEATFQGMKRAEILEWAEELGIPSDFRKALQTPYDLAMILLGDAYLDACMIDTDVKLGGPTLLCCAAEAASRLPTLPGLRTVSLGNTDARRLGCGLVGLKGEIAARLLVLMTREVGLAESLLDPATNIVHLVERIDSADFLTDPLVAGYSNPSAAWRERSASNPFRYFIPDWNDLVDPHYDFDRDIHPGGSPDWSNHLFAHQIYKEPNYDGILVSRFVAEESDRKKRLLDRLGDIHRFLRVPDYYPVMGDCGAFGYIGESEPPYKTDEIADYYSRHGFNYGVSIDHILNGRVDRKDQVETRRLLRRYRLTLQNARAFLEKYHRTAEESGVPPCWEPVGAVQGWDPRSYAAAAYYYTQILGYRHIAIGGLVRRDNKEIIAVLDAVQKRLPAGVRMHLFGLTRPEVVTTLRDQGATSADSASVLRRAWLGSSDNYLIPIVTEPELRRKAPEAIRDCGPGELNWYSAARIAQIGGSFRTKQVLGPAKESREKLVSALKARFSEERKRVGQNRACESIRSYVAQLKELALVPPEPVEEFSAAGLTRCLLRLRAGHLASIIRKSGDGLARFAVATEGEPSDEGKQVRVKVDLSLDKLAVVLGYGDADQLDPDGRRVTAESLLKALKQFRASRLAESTLFQAEELLEADRRIYRSRRYHPISLTEKELIPLERECLQGFRRYAQEDGPVPESVLEALTIYDALIHGPVDEYDPLGTGLDLEVDAEGLLLILDSSSGKRRVKARIDPLSVRFTVPAARSLFPQKPELASSDSDLVITGDGQVAVEWEPLIRGTRRGTRRRLEQLLTDKPWRYCDCDQCRGERPWELLIFRGNDRNRRRGFHNTYVLYKRLQLIFDMHQPEREQNTQTSISEAARTPILTQAGFPLG